MDTLHFLLGSLVMTPFYGASAFLSPRCLPDLPLVTRVVTVIVLVVFVLRLVGAGLSTLDVVWLLAATAAAASVISGGGRPLLPTWLA
jgi:hypothetical protein